MLASIGVYGVLSYSVSQRVQEIGVRLALGAERSDVLQLIVGQGLRLAAVGVVGGLVGAAAVTPVIRTLLYNVTPTDPLSFARRRGLPDAGRDARELHPGPPRDGGRSDRRAAQRLRSTRAQTSRCYHFGRVQLDLPFLRSTRITAADQSARRPERVEFVRMRRAAATSCASGRTARCA